MDKDLLNAACNDDVEEVQSLLKSHPELDVNWETHPKRLACILLHLSAIMKLSNYFWRILPSM